MSGTGAGWSPSDRDAALGRLRDPSVCPTGGDEHDEVLARVAWSTVVEPGDSDAGQLVARLGAGRSVRAVLEALDATRLGKQWCWVTAQWIESSGGPVVLAVAGS